VQSSTLRYLSRDVARGHSRKLILGEINCLRMARGYPDRRSVRNSLRIKLTIYYSRICVFEERNIRLRMSHNQFSLSDWRKLEKTFSARSSISYIEGKSKTSKLIDHRERWYSVETPTKIPINRRWISHEEEIKRKEKRKLTHSYATTSHRCTRCRSMRDACMCV